LVRDEGKEIILPREARRSRYRYSRFVKISIKEETE